MSDGADGPAGWTYIGGESGTSESSGVSLKQPRTAASRYVPSVAYDAEEKTLTLTFRG